MLWWDWTGAQRLRLMAVMLGMAAIPWVLLGWFTHQWRALPGGTALLLMPQVIAWLLFVGLKTGRMPIRGGSESRAGTPAWFWITAAIYGALLLLFIAVILAFLTDIVRYGLN